jgi:H+/Cl- antiporter ClcA
MREARDSVALLLAGLVAVFILGTLVVVFVLALRGVALPDTWDSLFGLVIAVMCALGGWLVGKNSNGKSTEEKP